MASKKELEKRIIDLEAQVRRLENMHARVLPSGVFLGKYRTFFQVLLRW